MKRLLLVTTGVLLLAAPACSNTQPVAQPGCAQPDFDLSACDRSGLASVPSTGIWHANVVLSEVSTPAAFRVEPDQSLLFSSPVTESQLDASTFFLASDYTNGLVSTRLAIAACQSSSPQQMQGLFRRCSSGSADLDGTFQAARVARVAGEQEGSGLKLVSETALPRGTAANLFVSGGYAYVSALGDGLFIYDVRKPEAPVKVAELTPSNELWHQVWVKDQTLYIASSTQGLLVYDVSNPAAPKIVNALPSPPVQAWGLYVDGTQLYVMSPAPNGEVLVYDIQKPAQPSLLARYYVEDAAVNLGEIPVEGVVVARRLYLGHWRYGLAVADVSNPTLPTTLGRFGYDQSTSRPVAAGVIGERTIAFEASEGWDSRVRALDVSDPQHIAQVGQFQMRPESTVSAMTLVGTRLYVAWSQDGLRVLDMSNPSTPRQLSYYNTWRESDPGRGRNFIDGLSAVTVPGDGFVYAAETSRGLLVFSEQ